MHLWALRFAIVAALLAGLWLGSRMEGSRLRVYCENVERGVWPDFNEEFETSCKKTARKTKQPLTT